MGYDATVLPITEGGLPSRPKRVPHRTTILVGSIVYGLLVFLGTAGLGFVALPTLAHATGLFPVDTEAEAAFSMVTLKAVPFLASLSTAAAFSYQWLAQLSIVRRLAVYGGTTLLAWVVAAAIAAFLLG